MCTRLENLKTVWTRKTKQAEFLVRKYSAATRSYVWNTFLGEGSVVESKVSPAIGVPHSTPTVSWNAVVSIFFVSSADAVP
jgi:hypothetical protein